MLCAALLDNGQANENENENANVYVRLKTDMKPVKSTARTELKG